jgi:hypothetical protein
MHRRTWPALLVLAALPGCRETTPSAAEAAEAADRPAASPVKLGVYIVFDQMRGDFPGRWRSLFGEGGFKRLQAEGVWFTDAHCPYAWTSTAPGHASLGTGATPSVHGIIENVWYDRRADELVSGSDEDRYDRVPTLASELPRALYRGEDRGAGSPGRMLAPAIGESLKKATGGKGRVFAFSLKDRGAILLGGAKVDGCYWFDGRTGTFVTSSYYRDGLHPWAARFNRERVADRWFGKPWERLRGDVDYEKYSGPDDVIGEDNPYRLGRTFPHPMTGGLPAPGKDYYRALTWSPFGNDLMWELARRCAEAEKLGQGDTTDLLCVSFSANDTVGHAWGPDSQEVLDVTLRSDRLLAEMLAWLEKTVGKGRFFVVVASDHGVPPLLSVRKREGKSAVAMRPGLLDRLPEEYLEATLGAPLGRARYIRGSSDFNIYLDHGAIARRGLKVRDVADRVAAWQRKQPEVQAGYTEQEVREAKAPDEVLRMVRRSFYPGRSGDIVVVTKPYVQGSWTGSNHGTPHPYDTHVTLLALGPGIKPGVRKERASMLLAPAILARGLGIEPPAKAEARVPDDLFTPP